MLSGGMPSSGECEKDESGRRPVLQRSWPAAALSGVRGLMLLAGRLPAPAFLAGPRPLNSGGFQSCCLPAPLREPVTFAGCAVVDGGGVVGGDNLTGQGAHRVAFSPE